MALRVNGMGVARVKVRYLAKGPELVATDPLLEEFAVDESFTVELLELAHSNEIQRRLPNGGWRKVSLRILIALLRNGVISVAEEIPPM